MGAQGTPEQRYADWATPAFPTEEYAARRTALAGTLTAGGGGVRLTLGRAGPSEGSPSGSSTRSGT